MGKPTSLCCGTVYGGGIQEGTMPLAWLFAGFQSLPLLPTSQSDPSGADSRVGGFVYVLEPCGFLQGTLLWGWAFLPLLPQPLQIFTARGFEAFFSHAGTLSCTVSLPSCSSQLTSCKCGTTWSSSHHLVVCPLHPDYLSPPILPGWMNVSSLTPWF